MQVRNVYVFPGIPRLLQAKFDAARDTFRGEPVYLRRVYVSLIESDIAADLNELLVEFAELMLGSYPRTSARRRLHDHADARVARRGLRRARRAVAGEEDSEGAVVRVE